MIGEVEIRSELVRTADGKIPYRRLRAGGYEHYNVRVQLAGPAEALDRVASVEYELHPSFRNRHRKVSSRETNFALELWCWGMFDMQVSVNFVDGRSQTSSYYLRFELPDDTGDNYVEIE